jgi:2'-5' RNA ligase
MHGIVSLLPQPYYGEVEKLWDQLEKDFGLTGIRVTPFPHFSWQIGETYDESLLQDVLDDISKNSSSITVQTTGLGVFSGTQPVIFIPVVKSPELIDFHSKVWERLEPCGTGISPYYNPENWVPHISLAYSDVNSENLGPVLTSLAFRTFNWVFEVNNFVYIYEPEGEIGTIRIRADF